MSDYLSDISVMVVDDQEFTVKMLAQMLRVLGARDVRTCMDADTAWKEMKLKCPDMLLLDWAMQPVDGVTLAKRIRNDPESPNVYLPIIMVTAYREAEHVFTARDAGVNEYVIKPIAPKTLFSRIQMIVEKPRRFVRVGEFFGPDRRRASKTYAKRYSGEMRREEDDGAEAAEAQDGAEAAAKPDMKRKMSQQEINEAFNPDEAPESSDAADD